MRTEEGEVGAEEGAGGEAGRGRGGGGDAPLRRARLAFLSFRTVWVSASLPGAGREGARPSFVLVAIMWPPDSDPDPDPEPGGRSQPGAAVPGLRALLPARAFLCSLKGRLLLAESVSAARSPPSGPLGGASERALPTPLGAQSSGQTCPRFRLTRLSSARGSEARWGLNPRLPESSRQCEAEGLREARREVPGPWKCSPALCDLGRLHPLWAPGGISPLGPSRPRVGTPLPAFRGAGRASRASSCRAEAGVESIQLGWGPPGLGEAPAVLWGAHRPRDGAGA